ncbi:hypothetical protein BDV96DRAFT_645266 [Lophiotrema nucula]|uniref:Uncharacterized protein n=1 Tax=Lophiotrema nucula TaxID=690887 RepID=A0A6A5ZBL1_9PLEO|nr:hypothetical protein BDV96DRAFT_645266 [Lophiotrema nucula]
MPYEQPPTDNCFFLDKIPVEIRLQIYEYLVVANEPLKGRTARNGARYGLSLPILRTNRQVYDEAQDLFFGKNTFYITSIPEDEISNKDKANYSVSENQQRFDPPLHPQRWDQLRHLAVDLVYYPGKTNSVDTPREARDSKPSDPGATAYISSLTTLLSTTGPTLHSFTLTACVSESFCARKSLISFFICDRNAPFVHALAAIPLGAVPVKFEFPDCFYHVDVKPGLFVSKSILLLACQVMFCQSQVRIDRLLEAFEGDKVGRREEEGRVERMDLGPYIGAVWPRRSKETGVVA